MAKLKVEYIALDALKAYERNTRTHSKEQVEQLKASIAEFGFTNPVLIDEENVLIAGHGRTEAARELGMTEVPAIRIKGLTEAQRNALRIADNSLALNAGWNTEALREELESLKDADFDVGLLGLDDLEIDGLNIDEIPPPVELVEDEPPEEDEVEPRCNRGDIWQLGDHRLMCGDSTNADDVARLMDGVQADLLLTDPPYNVAYEGKTDKALTITNDSMEDGKFRAFLTDAFNAAMVNLKPGGAFYIWHADSEGFNFRVAAREAGLNIRQCLIWVKNSLVLGRQDYQWKHEPCLYGWKEGAGHHWYGDRKQTTVLEFDKPTRSGEHPTMKPVALFAYQIGNSTAKGQFVLDLFGGSGTTLIACEQLGRKARLMELDPKYCDVILARWEKLTGRTAERIA